MSIVGFVVAKRAWIKPFLKAYEKCFTIEGAATAVGITRQAYYAAAKADPELAAAVEEIRQDRYHAGLEKLASWAFDGWDEAQVHQGVPTGHTVRVIDPSYALRFAAKVIPALRDSLDIKHSGEIIGLGYVARQEPSDRPTSK